MSSQPLPPGWDAGAQQLWSTGQRPAAVQAVLATINTHGRRKPLPLVLQFAYYLALLGDTANAAGFLQRVRPDYPRDPDLLRNLAVCLGRSNQSAAAVEVLRELLAITPDDALAHDSLSSALGSLGQIAAMRAAGTRALQLKDAAAGTAPADWSLPAASPAQFLARRGGRDVIAFSLWGANPRYLRGAIDNALARAVYPGWTLRYSVDATVPAEIRDELARLGAEVRLEAPGQPDRQRLAWRFQVANDPGVGRFLVRDVDSVLNPREARAVAAWSDSGRWFHVMRDWRTHTDLMLAGMWGGIAGVLPDLGRLLAAYRPPAMETPNIDQWFLRDQVWKYVRASCLMHDRHFTLADSQPWPEPDPPGSLHVGQDVFAARHDEQEQRLAAWIARLPSLRPAGAA